VPIPFRSSIPVELLQAKGREPAGPARVDARASRAACHGFCRDEDDPLLLAGRALRQPRLNDA